MAGGGNGLFHSNFALMRLHGLFCGFIVASMISGLLVYKLKVALDDHPIYLIYMQKIFRELTYLQMTGYVLVLVKNVMPPHLVIILEWVDVVVFMFVVMLILQVLFYALLAIKWKHKWDALEEESKKSQEKEQFIPSWECKTWRQNKYMYWMLGETSSDRFWQYRKVKKKFIDQNRLPPRFKFNHYLRHLSAKVIRDRLEINGKMWACLFFVMLLRTIVGIFAFKWKWDNLATQIDFERILGWMLTIAWGSFFISFLFLTRIRACATKLMDNLRRQSIFDEQNRGVQNETYLKIGEEEEEQSILGPWGLLDDVFRSNKPNSFIRCLDYITVLISFNISTIIMTSHHFESGEMIFDLILTIVPQIISIWYLIPQTIEHFIFIISVGRVHYETLIDVVHQLEKTFTVQRSISNALVTFLKKSEEEETCLYQAIRKYTTKVNGELSFKKNQKLIVKKSNGLKWHAEFANDPMKEGLVPHEYIEEVKLDSKSKLKSYSVDLSLRIISASYVPKMNFMTDSYVVVTAHQSNGDWCTKSTSKKNISLEPKWNEDLHFPSLYPKNDLHVELRDKISLNSKNKKYLGSVRFKIDPFIPEECQKPVSITGELVFKSVINNKKIVLKYRARITKIQKDDIQLLYLRLRDKNSEYVKEKKLREFLRRKCEMRMLDDRQFRRAIHALKPEKKGYLTRNELENIIKRDVQVRRGSVMDIQKNLALYERKHRGKAQSPSVWQRQDLEFACELCGDKIKAEQVDFHSKNCLNMKKQDDFKETLVVTVFQAQNLKKIKRRELDTETLPHACLSIKILDRMSSEIYCRNLPATKNTRNTRDPSFNYTKMISREEFKHNCTLRIEIWDKQISNGTLLGQKSWKIDEIAKSEVNKWVDLDHDGGIDLARLEVHIKFQDHEPSQLSHEERKLLQRIITGVELKDRTVHLKIYQDCFIASELITWMVKEKIQPDRKSAVAHGEHLRQMGAFEHAGVEHSFEDKELFYKLKDIDFIDPNYRQMVKKRQRTKASLKDKVMLQIVKRSSRYNHRIQPILDNE